MHALLTRPLHIVRGTTIRDRHMRTAYLFVAPCVLFFTITFIWPVLYGLYLTVHRFSFTGQPSFIGLKAYQAVLRDKLFWTSVRNTVQLLLLSVVPTMVLALAAAALFSGLRRGVGRSLFRAIYFLPVITSAVAVAFVWSWLYHPQNGLINELVRPLGVAPQNWLFDRKLVLPSLAVMNIWARLGFDMIIFLAGLESIPVQYYEAAMLDGAGPWGRFRHITLPLLNPQIVLVAIFEVISALKIFDLPYVATAGGPANASRVAVFHIYDLAFRWNRMGEAIVAALFLFVVIMVVTALQWRLLRSPVEY